MRRGNLIDVAVLIAIVAATTIGVAAYRRFQTPRPQIVSIAPARLTSAARRLTIHGRYLQPYLRAIIEPSGRPFVMNPSDPLAHEAIPIESTATELVVEMPQLTVGAYDLYLCDEFELLASARRAFDVTEPDYPRAMTTATIRFFVAPTETRLIAVGDRDASEPASSAAPPSAPAVVTAIRIDSGNHDEVEMRVAEYERGDASVWMGRRQPVAQVDADVQVPLLRDVPDAWRYRGRTVRAGDALPFETPRFKAVGAIVAVSDPRPASAGLGAR